MTGKRQPIRFEDAPIGSHLPVAWGWDTLVETYDLFPSSRSLPFLETWKEIASEEGERIAVQIGGHDFWMLPVGSRRWPWILEDAFGDFVLKLRSPAAPDYGVMVEYRSALLWSLDDPLDWSAAQAQIYGLLKKFCVAKGEEGPPLIRRADYAFDFYAPEFTEQSTPAQWDNWCCHQEVKRSAELGRKIWGRKRVETWTLGSKKSLQLCLYNKALEITEVSGKTWMHDIYKATSDQHRVALYTGETPVDVWRLEYRMFKSWLKRRHFGPEREKAYLRRVFVENAENIVYEAMTKISLRIPDGPGVAKQLDRRPMRWLWGAASRAIGGAVERPYVANLATGKREALSDIARKSIYGYIRSWAVLENLDSDETTLDELLSEAHSAIVNDPDHEKKIDMAKRRYAMVDRPQ